MKAVAVALVWVLAGLAAAPAVRAGVADPYDRSGVPIEVQPADPTLAKVVLVAGDMGTGHGPGQHEHFAGCALFMRMLRQTPGVWPVMVRDGWPKDPAATFKDAKAVVFYMDGGGKQTTIAHAAEIDKLAAAGVGIVHVHQVVDYPANFVEHAARWVGGAYGPKTGSRGHWDGAFDAFPAHAVTRGVTPWTVNDGFIQNLTWVEGAEGITPILRTRNPKAKAGLYANANDDVVCWTYDRPDGGRSFAMTGGDMHKHWGHEGMRRLLINGILWTAKVEVPEGGAPVALDPADLMQNMDRKPAPVKKPAAAKPAAAGAAKGS
jgi:hypothetical protein